MDISFAVVLPLLVLQLLLAAVALFDLFRREPERINGPRWVWALVCIVISTFGPIAYFIFGRRD